MCGIAGIVTTDASADVSAVLARMTGALRHRGPDSQGCEIRHAGAARVGLGHTRLAIIDLSDAGRQPMTARSGRTRIVYNGEVYNFQELRDDLAARGRSFRSHTDTEVILEALESRGPEALAGFRGMFAFAALDDQRRELLLARDPLGIKPLYYWRRPGTLLFASEVRALLHSGLVPRRLSAEGAAGYLRSACVEAPFTAVEGVFSLPPGTYATVRCDDPSLELKQARYSNPTLRNRDSRPPRNREAAVRELRSLLEESVRMHLVSDVPLGVFLSGGIDSSTLVALTALASETPKTFSVIFKEPAFSEHTQARAVAERFRTDHREVLLTEERLLEMLPDAFASMDQPSMDGINTYVVSRAVKEAGITVALSGLGGDELFAGYQSFRRAQRIGAMRAIPAPVRRGCAAIARGVVGGSTRGRKFCEALVSDASPRAAYEISRRVFSDAQIAALTGGHRVPATLLDAAEGDAINVVSSLELQGYMSNMLLRDSDFMSMAHALELRVPFLDPKLVEFVVGLPGAWKSPNGTPKPLLVDAVRDLLPEEVWNRPKMGFGLPFERWMQSTLRADIEHAFGRDEGLRNAGLEPRAAASIWRAFREAPRSEKWSHPWTLYVLGRWCEINGVAA